MSSGEILLGKGNEMEKGVMKIIQQIDSNTTKADLAHDILKVAEINQHL
jgi:hypothetical protein